VYVQVDPEHAAPALWVVSHASPHAPQLVIVFVGVSQPLVSGAVVLQSAQPAEHPVYLHVVPSHVAPVLWVVSQVRPHALQFDVVSVCVSQPSESGAVLVQSAQPGLQPVYLQVVPSQVAPTLCVVSHVTPHALQLLIVFVLVSQPSVSGAVLVQSAQPAMHPM
jgi:hypothetical protein